MSCFLNHASAICALGNSYSEINNNLFECTNSPLTVTDKFSPGRDIALGVVKSELPVIKETKFNTRNNQLLLHCLNQLKSEIGELKNSFRSNRIGAVIGSSTSGILEGEQAIFYRHQHNTWPDNYHYVQQEIGAPSEFVKHYLEIYGPTLTVSTACTSGAKALASAKRLIQLGVCDAVIAGGADSLCRLTVEGFSSLEAVSVSPCQPFSKNRKGINIGEAAALFIVSKNHSEIQLSGYGESSDAHHISAPHPNGDGARSAMSKALLNAQLNNSQIDYLNLHGTATQQNDAMESIATVEAISNQVACSSSKMLTGHTLGAAGALEAYFSWLTLKRSDGALPSCLWDEEYDPELTLLKNYGKQRLEKTVKTVMSNSFAFGGNNISLILERTS